MKTGDCVNNTWVDRLQNGIVQSITGNLVTVRWKTGEILQHAKERLLVVTAYRVPAHKRVLLSTEALDCFIDSLWGKVSLYVKSRYEHADDVREQYLFLAGERLTEGQGFSVYEQGSNKWASDGVVLLQEPYSGDDKEILALFAGSNRNKIQRMGFFWLLVSKGFRVNR